MVALVAWKKNVVNRFSLGDLLMEYRNVGKPLTFVGWIKSNQEAVELQNTII